ncbi:MAG: TonB-dependent receptor [Flavisolibacter sp.]
MLSKLLAFRLCVVLCLSFIFSSAFSQQRTVVGSVKNPDNTSVAGATVVVRGTNISTQTDADGNFSISVPESRNTLTITSVGYEARDVNISGQNTVSVSLTSSTSTLNEVVVTGYTAQRKKEITGSVSVVNVNQMKQVPAGTGEEALQGRASGVTIITSGQPGAGSDIRIRGITGFGNNQPLVIVDGVHSSLRDLNLNDIESVQVLKDASAAIYGLAGSNGVIIVTTKKGRTAKARISYDGYYGVTTPGKGYDMASTQEEANAIFQQLKNSGLNPGDANFGNKQFGKGATPVIPDYITPTGYTLTGGPGDSIVNPAFYDINTNQITRANKQGTNWYKEITRNALTQSHNVSVSAGTDKSTYFFSMNYLNQDGIAKFQYLKRYAIRANTQFNVKDHIRVGENAYIFYKRNPIFGNQGEGSPFSVVFREDAIIPVYDIMGNFAGTKSQGLGNARNPYADIFRTKNNRQNTWNVVGNVFAEADILRHFTVRTDFGGTVNNNYSYNFNYVGYENAEGNTGSNSFSENASYNSSWIWTNTLTYANTIGNHNFRILGGTEALSSYGRGLGGTRSGYFSENPNFFQLNTGGSSGQANSGYSYQDAVFSLLAKVEYSFASKYLVTGSFRRDGASVFFGSAQYSNFPSVTAAWRISQEDFMRPISWIDDLKLRYSWGKLGNRNNVSSTNPYNLFASRPGRSYYDIGGTSNTPAAGFYRSNIGNTSTTFEGDIISNAGFDATLFHNKIDFTIDYYKKKISGLLFQASGTAYDVIYTGGAGLPQVNIGDMQNTGIDGSITYHGTITKDFKIDLTGIFTSYKNKIVSIPGLPYFDGPQIRNVKIDRNEVGHSVGEFFGYKVIGLFQDAADVSKSPKQNDAMPGVFKYADVNGDGVIDEKDRTYIGNPNPKFSYGLNIGLNYKAFDFSAFFSGQYGNDIFDQTKYFTDFPDFFKGGIRRDVALHAFVPGTNTNTDIPLLRNTGGFSTDQVTNSYFISKGSYLRNKQMQLGYTLPTRLLNRYGIERMRIYVQSANLFTITKYKGLDPELSSPNPNDRTPLFGVDQGNYPHTPSYLVGVNLNF